LALEVEQLKENDTTRQNPNVILEPTYKDTIYLGCGTLSKFLSIVEIEP